MDNKITVDRACLFSPLGAVSIRADIPGLTDMRALGEAIKAAVGANRVFCSRVEMAEDGSAELVPAERIVCKASVTQKSYQQIVSEQDELPFDLESGEMVRFFLRQTADGTELIIISHKLICDQTGLLILLEDILTSLSGQAPETKPAELLSPDDLPDKTEMLLRMTAKQSNKNWLKNKEEKQRVFSFEDRSRIFDKYFSENKTTMIRQRLGQGALEAVDRVCVEYGVAAESVIVLAIIMAIGNMANISLSVDCRQTEDRTIHRTSFGAAMLHGYDERRDVCANIQYMQEILDDIRYNDAKLSMIPGFIASLEPGLVDSMFMAVLDGYKDKTSARVTELLGYDGDTGCVGLSVIDPDWHPGSYGRYDVREVTYCPPCELNERLSIAVLVNPSIIELVIHCKSEKAVGEAKTFMQKLSKSLLTLTTM